MANLLGSSIEPNYRGILNLGYTINQPLSGTLQSITDGMGNASPLSLSTTIVGIGRTGVDGLVNWRRSFDGNGVAAMGVRPGFSDWYFEGNNVNFRTNSTGFFIGGGSTWVTPTARLHVRGDGTNPIFRFESSTGAVSLQMLNSGALTLNEGSLTIGNGNISVFGKISTLGGYNNTSGTIITSLDLANTIVNAAGSANNRIVSIAYTVNNSGAQTGSLTGIFLNVTETNRNGQSSDFVNFQNNSVQRFRVDSTGAVFASNTIQTVDLQLQGGQQAIWNASGRILLANSFFNGFDRLQFGGTTSVFPALKRSGTILEVRLADDSGYAQLGIGSLAIAGYAFAVLSTRYFIDQDTRNVAFGASVSIKGGNVAADNSAILDVASTTKGFLLPRMTTTQKNAISTPATGLVVFDTDLGKLCVFSGTWQTVTSA